MFPQAGKNGWTLLNPLLYRYTVVHKDIYSDSPNQIIMKLNYPWRGEPETFGQASKVLPGCQSLISWYKIIIEKFLELLEYEEMKWITFEVKSLVRFDCLVKINIYIELQIPRLRDIKINLLSEWR